MAKTPGQLFAEKLFGGIQAGVEGLPRAVRQNRLDERQRNQDSFTQLLNVQRVTQAFKAQQLREEKNQQALLQTESLQRGGELLGTFFEQQDPSFVGPPASGLESEILTSFAGGGTGAGTLFNIGKALQPEQGEDGIPSFEQTDAVAGKIRREEPLTASDFDVLDRANRKVTDFELKEGEKAPKPTTPDVNARKVSDRIRKELITLDNILGSEAENTGLINESENIFGGNTQETEEFIAIKNAIDKLLRGPAGGSALLQRIESALTNKKDINAQTELLRFLKEQGIRISQSTLDKIFAKARQVSQPQPTRSTGSNNDLITERERLLKQLK